MAAKAFEPPRHPRSDWTEEVPEDMLAGFWLWVQGHGLMGFGLPGCKTGNIYSTPDRVNLKKVTSIDMILGDELCLRT